MGVKTLRPRQSLVLQLGDFAYVMHQWCFNGTEALSLVGEEKTFVFEPVVLDMPVYVHIVGKIREVRG